MGKPTVRIKEKTREQLAAESMTDNEIAEIYVGIWVSLKELEDSAKVFKEELSSRYAERYGDGVAGVAIDAGSGITLEREPGVSSHIDKVALLNLGVDVDVIKAATKTTSYFKWQVRAPKVGKI